MDGYEYKINATYNKNVLFFQKEHPHIYKKIQEAPKQLKNYKIIFYKTIDGGYFNIQHLETGKLFYKEDPKIEGREFIATSNDSKDFFVTTVEGHKTNKMSVSIDDYDEIISYIKENNNKEERIRLNPHKLVFLGAGVGTHIDMASKEFSTLRALLVIEPDIELFRISAMFIDYEDISKRQLLFLSSNENEDEMYYRYRQLESPFASYNFSIKFSFLNHTYRQYLAPITKRFMTTNIYELSFEHFLSKDENKYHNLFNYPTLDFFRTTVNKDIPVMLIMSGPSLAANMDFLKKAKNKFLLITVGSALYKLYKHDIVPDVCFAMDGKKRKIDEFTDLPKEYLEKIQFFIADLVDPNVSKILNPIITFNRAQRTVGHHALAVICEFGFKSIYTVGNDVCVSSTGKEYVEGLHFKDKLENAQKKNSKGLNYDKLMSVEGNFRKTVESKMKFLSYVKTYEGMKDAFYYGLKVYNLSDGALIKGMDSLYPGDLNLDKFDDIADKSKCINYKLLELTKTNIEKVDYDKHIKVAITLEKKIDDFVKLNIPSRRLDEYLNFRDANFLGDFAKQSRESDIVNDSIIRYIMFADNSMLNFFDNKNFSQDEFEKHFLYIFDLYIKGFKEVILRAKNTLIYAKKHFDKLSDTESKINIYINMNDDEYLLYTKLKNRLEVETKQAINIKPLLSSHLENKEKRVFLAPFLSDFKTKTIVLDAKKHQDSYFDIVKLYDSINDDKVLLIDEEKEIYLFNNNKCNKLSLEYVKKSKTLSSLKWVNDNLIIKDDIKIDNNIKNNFSSFYVGEKDISPIYGDMPRENASIVYLMCIDSALFKKYYKFFLKSASENNNIKDVHFHCINTFGTNEESNQKIMDDIHELFPDINATLSYENQMLRNTDKQFPKVYYYCLSFFVLEEILNASKADVFNLSLASLIMNPIDKVQKTKSDVSYYIGGNDDSNFMVFYKNTKNTKKLAHNLRLTAFYELRDKTYTNDMLFSDIFNHNLKCLPSLKTTELNEKYRDFNCEDDSYIWLSSQKSSNYSKYQYKCFQISNEQKDKKDIENVALVDIEAENKKAIQDVSSKSKSYNTYSGYIDVSFLDSKHGVMFLQKSDDTETNNILYRKQKNQTTLNLWCVLAREKKEGYIYNLGAGSGIFSISAQLFFSNIVSLENDMFNYNRLTLNLSINKLNAQHSYFMNIGNKKSFIYNNKNTVLENTIKTTELSFMDLKKNFNNKKYLIRVGKNFIIDDKSIKNEINENYPDLLIEDIDNKWIDELSKKYTLWYIDEKNKNISKENVQQAYIFATIRKEKEIIKLLNGVLDVKVN